MKEVEIKFRVRNFRKIKEILKSKGGKFVGKAFERTVRFDTPKNNLAAKGLFLRVKTGFKNVITVKQRLAKQDRAFKERKEIEFEISDPKKMEIILKLLGFGKLKIMEKYREKWRFGKCEVVLDRLPFGNFIEIEGGRKAIKKAAKLLGLDFKKSTTAIYWELWRKFKRIHKIKRASEDIIFNGDLLK